MQEFEKKDFSKILKRNALDCRRWMNETDSTVCRVYDRNLESFPVTVELYGPYARIVDYADGGMDDDSVVITKDLVSRFLYVEHDKVIYTARKKREGREQHEKGDESLSIIVKENGLEFECELLRYVDTGLFLDHAETREMIRNEAMGMRVLNLFSYTGSFSVYAASGGAESVTSVDLSNVYTAWARRNLDRNGFLDPGKYRVVASDAWAYLEEAKANGERYDIVIFDPPAFSNSHKAEDFDVERDYERYLARISSILAPGGCVLFSENLSGFTFYKESLKAYWKIRELTGDVKALGFASKRSSMRVWWMKKVADMDERSVQRRKSKVRRKMDEEKFERLEIDAYESEKAPEERRERRRERRQPEERPRDYRERGYRSERPRYRDERRYDDRPRYRDRDDRPRYRDDRPRYRDDDRGYRSERPRYRDERRSYDDRPRYRDDRYPSRPRRRENDWDNETGRAYRSSRYDDRRDRREERRPYSRDDNRYYGREEKRKKAPPKPYGYDDFHTTKKREDGDDYFWMKNTEVQEYKDENK